MNVSRHDRAADLALEQVAWLRRQGVSIGEAMAALPERFWPGVTCWDGVLCAYARAWLESVGRKS